MTGSTWKKLTLALFRLPGARLVAAVAVAGSLMVPLTAPALLEGGSDRATGISGIGRDLDFYGGLLFGASYPSTDVFADADAASSSRGETDRPAGSERCDQLSNIDATALPASRSSSALPTRASLCFGPQDVIEYFASGAIADRRSVDLVYDKVPSAVRSTIADSQLMPVRPAVVDRDDDDDDDDKDNSRKSAAHASHNAHLSAQATWRRRNAAAVRPPGCARCAGQVAQTSAGPAKFFALPFTRELFRAAPSVRRERLPPGVAQQREALRVAAWIFGRGG